MEADSEIIKQCKKYDERSLVYLFHKYEKYLFNLCYGYTQNDNDALDLVQEIYIKVFNNIAKFNEDFPFRPWLRRIAVNTCLNYKRTIKSNVISLNRENDDGIEIQDNIASDYNVEQDILNSDTTKIIKQNIKKLPSKYRMIISLRYFEDLSYNQIAEVLHEPMGTVKTDIYRAKAMLKKSLKNDFND